MPTSMVFALTLLVLLFVSFQPTESLAVKDGAGAEGRVG